MQTVSYHGSEEDAETIGKTLLAYLAKESSCWNKIKRNTGYNDHEIADGMAWVRNRCRGLITHRDDEEMPHYAPTDVRHLYLIDENVVNVLKSKIEGMKQFLALVTPEN